jgi:aminopeptidase-like protein
MSSVVASEERSERNLDCREKSGREMHALATELFPTCRSITGDGLRATLRRIQQEVPILIREVKSGTTVLDWTIPDEWNVRDAWIKDSRGQRIVDFQKSNLHVVNYSSPVRARISLSDLKSRLHSLPQHPGWIPYRTTYYKREWGFCLPHRQLSQLADGEYDVCIDARLAPGSLSYGELLIPGEMDEEFLISCHACHPSLANDNLSGLVLAVALAKQLQQRRWRQYSYRFLFVPGTIGAITWLAQNRRAVSRIKHGVVLTCVGDAGNITYKKSRRGDAPIDRAFQQVLREAGAPHRVLDFSPYGYDERQFCSPGFNLPMGCLMRSQHGTFPEYHTSADNLDFLKPDALADSLEKLLAAIEIVESQGDAIGAAPGFGGDARVSYHVFPVTHQQRRFLNLKPQGEPQLGKYGVYEAFGNDVMPALWLLNFSDGEHSVSDIAARSGLSFDKLLNAADILVSRGLLKEVDP